MKVHLLTIDTQNDFCDPTGALFVKGADQDTKRLTALVNRLGRKIDAATLTLDSHHAFHIAHPCAWRNDRNDHPNPFSIISEDDVVKGVWKASLPGLQKWQREYVQKLAQNKRYPLCVWPYHCLIGGWGASLVPEFFDAIKNWELSNLRIANKVTKGSNIKTEHYSAVCADVPDPSDPHTQLNVALIDSLKDFDDILISGQALDFCVRNTIVDIANNFGDDNVKKFVLLEDCCSSVNVPGLEHLGSDFVKEMTARGMRVTTSKDYLV
jgi:nicotinamidase-related amidase